MRAVVAAVCAAAALVSGCAARTAGTPSAGSAPPSRHTAGLSCPGPTTDAIVSCLSTSLSAFWTAELGREITMHTVLDPSTVQVPRDCRAALRLDTAFSCPSDDVVYLTGPFVRRTRAAGPPATAWLRVAASTGHEMGHIVQFAVHEPLMTARRPTWAQSRRIEQQADCLGGVWSASVGINDAAFVAATRAVLSVVDSRSERRSHGTPAQRLAAVRRGQRARNPSACGLQRTPP